MLAQHVTFMGQRIKFETSTRIEPAWPSPHQSNDLTNEFLEKSSLSEHSLSQITWDRPQHRARSKFCLQEWFAGRISKNNMHKWGKFSRAAATVFEVGCACVVGLKKTCRFPLSSKTFTSKISIRKKYALVLDLLSISIPLCTARVT